jgi:hypothetical protein
MRSKPTVTTVRKWSPQPLLIRMREHGVSQQVARKHHRAVMRRVNKSFSDRSSQDALYPTRGVVSRMGKVELRDAFPGYRQSGRCPFRRGVWNTPRSLKPALISNISCRTVASFTQAQGGHSKTSVALRAPFQLSAKIFLQSVGARNDTA